MVRIYNSELQNLYDNPTLTNINVTWIGDRSKNWLITKNGVGIGGESYATKQEAIQSAREIASNAENRPSLLVVEYKKPNGDKRREAEVSDYQYYKS